MTVTCLPVLSVHTRTIEDATSIASVVGSVSQSCVVISNDAARC